MKDQKINYYTNELEDDFANVSRNTKKIDADYKYINQSKLWNIVAFFIYRIIMTPVAFFYCKFILKIKFINASVLRDYKKSGFYLYGNHTQLPGDGFIPTVLSFPVKPYVIVHPDNVSLKGTEQIMLMIGAMPIPQTMEGTKKFMRALEERIKEKRCIAIFPEAHIWPYYTKIRPFSSVSFKYPVKENVPCFCFTTCYKKKKNRKKPQIEVYVDGPFYSNEGTTIKEKAADLRNQIYNKMNKRSDISNYDYIKYIKRESDNL